jgi:hypothetical protein
MVASSYGYPADYKRGNVLALSCATKHRAAFGRAFSARRHEHDGGMALLSGDKTP